MDDLPVAVVDQIEPIAEQFRIGDIARRLRGITLHGVIFTPPSNSNPFRHGTLSVVGRAARRERVV